MVNQLRYPKIITQEECEVCSGWDNLEGLKTDNWEDVATCFVKHNQKPAPIKLLGFNFNIPKDVQVRYICVELDYTREESLTPIKMGPPTLRVNGYEKIAEVGPTIFQLSRIVKFNVKDFNLTADDVNDKDFEIDVEFPENKSDNEGNVDFDFARVRIEYEPPRYGLSCYDTILGFPDKKNPLKKAIGDEFTYTTSFRNLNGVGTDKQEVKINVPEGLELVKYYFNPSRYNEFGNEENVTDILDTENMIWYPAVRGLGVSRLRMIFKATSEGHKVINAFNPHTEYTKDFHVDVKPKGYESEKSVFEQSIEDDTWIVQEEDTEEFKSIVKETVIKVEDVSMEFDVPQEKIDTIKEYFIKWAKRDIKPDKHFKALKDVSFEITRGERVGIIGFNGAGKSTLLKVLAGVLKPTEGKTNIKGKIAPLLELGAGFDHNYSGRENIFLNGAILGYSKEFLESKYDEIVEFSELEEFIDIPIKNYSSGMVAKLGFAVATVVNPEILILDEILSVGDVKFQKKSGDKIRSMISSGTTVLLVSHSTAKIKEICNRAIWIDKGKVVMDGDVDKVCAAYIEAAEDATDDELQNLEFV